jgi:transposase
LKRDPLGGHIFVLPWPSRQSDQGDLWHDGQGGEPVTCVAWRSGRFIWPSPVDGAVTITPAQLGYLLEGIDWRNAAEDLAADGDRLDDFESCT